MLNNINILKMSSALARYSAQRHQQITENIANADTQNYRAKDLEPFADAYQRFSTETELTGETADLSSFAKPIDLPGIDSPNGNNVSLEDQMMRSIEAQQDHKTATLVYKKAIDLMRMTLNK